MKEPKLISFNQVKVKIPRKYILARYHDGEILTMGQTMKLSKKYKEIEKIIIRLRHVQSVVEQCLVRRHSDRPGYWHL